MSKLEIPDGGVGYGYDRIFAQCLDEKMKSVHVEDTYMFKKHQAENFNRFCEFLAEAKLGKCKNLERITLATLPEDRSKNRVAKFDRAAEFEKIKNWLIKSGIAFHVEYKNFHDRKIDFGNGWEVTLGRGLDYFKPPNVHHFCFEKIEKYQTWFPGGDSDTNRRPCEATTITIIRGRLLDEHTERSEIGRGRFGVVFKAQYKIDKRWYAIKQVGPIDAIDAIDAVDAVDAIDAVDAVDSVDAVDAIDAVDAVDSVDAIDTVDAVDAIDTVDAVDVARTKRPIEKVMREVYILAELDHSHIVRYYAAWLEKPPPGEELPMVDSNEPCLYIRMEFCCGPTLHKWLGQNQLPEQRPISQTLDWFRQLASTIEYIHDRKVIHRNLKPGNIFLGSSRDGAAPALKIGGFGLATYAPASSSSGASGDAKICLSIVGTEMYMSPEQPSGHYKNSTDIFSLGLVFLEMVYPFGTDRERRGAFGSFRSEQRPKVMNQLNKKVDELISWMAAFDPKKRPTASVLDNELKKKTAEELR